MSAAKPIGRAVFFSGEPKSIGHIYRVEQPVEGLRSAGWQAEWAPAADSSAHSKIDSACVVVVYRAVRDADFAEIRRRCTDRGIPLVYDTDDLIFDPDLAAGGKVAFLDLLGEGDRLYYFGRIEGYGKALAEADCATFSTEPLAAAARRFCKNAFVLPNILGPAMWQSAAAATRPQKPAQRGEARLIFASGTPSHHRDFREASGALARTLAKNPLASLTVLGELGMATFPELAPFSDRIEIRPRVPFQDLFGELARADVNLCPLELHNPFCEAKSAVRCLAASALGIPSIVSPTMPLLEAVANGGAGLVARDSTEWESALEQLIGDPDLRIETGRKAQGRALGMCDFSKWSAGVSRILLKTIGEAGPENARA